MYFTILLTSNAAQFQEVVLVKGKLHIFKYTPNKDRVYFLELNIPDYTS